MAKAFVYNNGGETIYQDLLAIVFCAPRVTETGVRQINYQSAVYDRGLKHKGDLHDE
jgi:hypothetical protein